MYPETAESKKMPMGALCSNCGAPLRADARHGFCPKCLFSKLALPASTDKPDFEEDVPSLEGTLFGNYQIEEEIGRGGMGIIFKARQLSLGRTVAIKLLLAGQFADAAFIRRFRTEATTAGMLKHPNIVGIHEVGIQDGQHYLVMDYVEGQNLAALCGREPLQTTRAVRYVKIVAEAIHYAHERGILHRDLKPANIVINQADQPQITDFGLARRLEENTISGSAGHSGMALTVTGQLLGSPNYMPPEQASPDKGKVGRHSDVYALGAVLYHLLTGRPPFLGETLSSTLHQVLHTEPNSPRLINPSVPADLETICLKCLEKEPLRRYGTAKELAEDLERFLKDEPIRARPVTRCEHFWRWCRRNRGLSAACTLVLLLLLGISIGSPIAAYRIHQAHALTEQQRQRALFGEAQAREYLYIADMSLAPRAWEENNVERLGELLGQTQDFQKRGFEWRFWRTKRQEMVKVLGGHLSPIAWLEFSPDGRLLATASDDQTVRIWDAARASEIRILEGHSGPVTGVAWFPNGERVVSSSVDHTIRIWEVRDGGEVATLRPLAGRVSSVAVEPTGSMILAGFQDGTARIFQTHDHRETLILRGHSGRVMAVAISPDGKIFATASADHTARLWDSRDGRCLRVLSGHNDYVRAVAFSKDGHHVVTGSDDRLALVWKTATGEPVAVLRGHTEFVRAVAFSPDGQQVATASEDLTAKLWRVSDGKELMTLNADGDLLHSVAFSPDGTFLATPGPADTAALWNLQRKLEKLSVLSPSPIFGIDLSPDGGVVAIAHGDWKVRIRETAEGREVSNPLLHQQRVLSVSFSHDGRKLVTGSDDFTARIWDRHSGSQLLVLNHPAAVRCAVFSPDGRRVVTGTHDATARIWDAETGGEVLVLKGCHSDSIRSVTFLPNGTRFVTASWDGTAKVWDAQTGEELAVFRGHSGPLLSVAASPDGRTIATASLDLSVISWNADTGVQLRTLRGHGGMVTSVSFSSSGDRILTSSADGTVKLWHAEAGTLLLTLSAGSPVSAAAFSRDGSRIAAGIADGAAFLWEAASAEQIAGWEEEEQQRGQFLARLRSVRQQPDRLRKQSRAADPGVIQDWLVLAPIAFDPEKTSDALEEEFVPREKQLAPRAGETIRIGGVDFTWLTYHSGSEGIEFASMLGRVTEHSVGYAVCYIRSESEQKNVRILTGSDDFAKIYLNAEEVYRSRFRRGFIPDEDLVEGNRLNPGLNVLVLKVVNFTAGWAASVRLTDEEGQPIQGIRVSLNP